MKIKSFVTSFLMLLLLFAFSGITPEVEEQPSQDQTITQIAEVEQSAVDALVPIAPTIDQMYAAPVILNNQAQSNRFTNSGFERTFITTPGLIESKIVLNRFDKLRYDLRYLT